MKAVVISCTRRYAIVSPDFKEMLQATASSKALEICVGDEVMCSPAGNEYRIDTVLPRRNELSRSYRGETQSLLANLDMLLVVVAVGKLFNTLILDRIITIAHSQGIPSIIVVNKIDLGVAEQQPIIDVYQKLGFEILLTSAKQGLGLDKVEQVLARPGLHTTALVGPSGVGKSSLLNRLIPDAERKIAEVSDRTGHGKQTTTQALGLLYARPEVAGILVIDPPGVQNFGVSHLSNEQVAEAFPEIVELRSECEYSDCSHIKEESCAIKRAVQNGQMAEFRYQSYLHMLAEIEASKPY